MSINFDFVEGTVTQKKVGKKGPNDQTAAMCEAIRTLPLNRAFKYENPTLENGKVRRMDGVWRSALKHLAATNDIHEPSQQPFSNLHFSSGEVDGVKVLVLLVGAPKARGKKEVVTAEV